jgi:hypothetical protein
VLRMPNAVYFSTSRHGPVLPLAGVMRLRG